MVAVAPSTDLVAVEVAQARACCCGGSVGESWGPGLAQLSDLVGGECAVHNVCA
jgi:hypothetical protein